MILPYVICGLLFFLVRQIASLILQRMFRLKAVDVSVSWEIVEVLLWPLGLVVWLGACAMLLGKLAIRRLSR